MTISMTISHFDTYSIAALNNIIRNLTDAIDTNQLNDVISTGTKETLEAAKIALSIKIEVAENPSSMFSKHFNCN